MKNAKLVLLVLSVLMLLSCDRKPDLPYLDACAHPDALKEVKYYVKHKISDSTGLLIAAEKNTNEKIIRELLKSKNIEDDEKLNALWHSLGNKNINVFIILLKETKGENSSIPKTGTTILMQACKEENKDIVNLLIKNGAKVNEQDKDGNTALMIACQKNNLDIVNSLLSAKADVNLSSNDGYSAFSDAYFMHHEKDILNALIKAGADVNVQNEGKTPLMEECFSNNIDMVKTLIAAGANVNSKDNDGLTSLHIACMVENLDIVNNLISAGADINAKAKDGITPLINAIWNNNLDIVDALIAAKVEINTQDETGSTALIEACKKGNLDMVKTLISAGSNIKIKNNNNSTAYAIVYISQPKNKDIIEVLEKAGADIKELYDYYGIKMIPIPGKNIEMLLTEVTQNTYKKVMGKNPSYFKGNNLPVEGISWNDAIEFCNVLSQKMGLPLVYSFNEKDYDVIDFFASSRKEVIQNATANGFRLPTVGEWQYSAKGGANYSYAGSEDINEVAWYDKNSDYKTHSVGEKKPNDYGLYDMSGNVREWCWDGSSGGRQCGGSWCDYYSYCKIGSKDEDSYGANIGFRIVRNK